MTAVGDQLAKRAVHRVDHPPTTSRRIEAPARRTQTTSEPHIGNGAAAPTKAWTSDGLLVAHSGDVRAYLQAAGGFLRQHRAEHAVMLTHAREYDPGSGQAHWLWACEHGHVVGAAQCGSTPPGGVHVSVGRQPVMAALAEALHARLRHISGVSGLRGPALAFAYRWASLTGAAGRVMSENYLLAEPTPGLPQASTRVLRADVSDPAVAAAYYRRGYRLVGEMVDLAFTEAGT